MESRGTVVSTVEVWGSSSKIEPSNSGETPTEGTAAEESAH
jgi:hypothetical protein